VIALAAASLSKAATTITGSISRITFSRVRKPVASISACTPPPAATVSAAASSFGVRRSARVSGCRASCSSSHAS